MSSHEFKSLSTKEMIDALQVARDRARVQAHLLSLDATKRWHELELSLVGLELKLEAGGQEVASAAAVRFKELMQTARELLREIDGRLELATPVRLLMCDLPKTCSPDDTLDRAAQLMWENDCGAVAVLNTDESLAGVVTDRDICMAAYTRGQPLSTISVYSTMSKQLHVCSPRDSLGDAIRLMANTQLRRLPVVDEGKLVGIVTLADIARHVGKYRGNSVPACVALADTLAEICDKRSAPSSARIAAE